MIFDEFFNMNIELLRQSYCLLKYNEAVHRELILQGRSVINLEHTPLFNRFTSLYRKVIEVNH